MTDLVLLLNAYRGVRKAQSSVESFTRKLSMVISGEATLEEVEDEAKDVVARFKSLLRSFFEVEEALSFRGRNALYHIAQLVFEVNLLLLKGGEGAVQLEKDLEKAKASLHDLEGDLAEAILRAV